MQRAARLRMPADTQTNRTLALLVAGTFFMENLDGTIVVTAAPAIGSSLGVTSVAVGVTITAYLLTLAVLVPLSGWISRRFGARRVFLAAIVIFTVGSVLCATSAGLLELTLFRVLQAAGGALMVPVGRLVVLRTTPREGVLRAIALLTWPALAAPVIAPLIGGLIVTYASWQWIFLVNAPLGVIAFVVAFRLMPHEEQAVPSGPGRPALPGCLDWVGAVLVGAGLGMLVYGGSLVTATGSGLSAAAWALGGLIVLAAAILHLLRSKNPLLSLRVLRIPSLRLSNASGSVFRMTISAVPFLLPLLFQSAFGATPVFSGTMVLFLFVGNILIKPATTPLLRRFGFRLVIVAATAGAVLSMVLIALLTPSTPVAVVIAMMVFSGVVRSVGFTAYNSIAFADVEPGELTEVNTVASTFQQLAAGFGVALGALALSFGEMVAGSGSASGAGSGGYQFAFLALAALTVVPVVGALRADHAIGDSLRPASSLTRTAGSVRSRKPVRSRKTVRSRKREK